MNRLKLEITETALIDDLDLASEVITQFHQYGASVAMDDFGTGYSSLTWLAHLPVDTLKIDASFVKKMSHHRQSRKIVSSVISLGHNLEMNVIAEGVETEAEAQLLRALGCDSAQGFLFSKPVPAEMTLSLASSLPATNNLFPGRTDRLSLDKRAYHISSMYSAAGTSICFLDPQLTIIDASPTFCLRLDKKLGDILNRHIHEVLPQEVASIAWLRVYREKGLPYPPYRITLPNGNEELVLISRIIDEIGDLLGFCVLGVEMNEVIDRTKIIHK